jgi:hypothetical protein
MGRGSVKVKKAGREEDYWSAFFFVESVGWPVSAWRFTLSDFAIAYTGSLDQYREG